MADQWYFARSGQRFGPFSQEHLQQAAATGQLAPSDLVWREGMPDWSPASSVPGLFAQPHPGYPPLAGPGAVSQQGAPIAYAGVLPYQANYVQYAGFWLRFCAAFVDGIVLGIVNAVITFGLYAIFDEGAPATEAMEWAIAVILAWMYDALQESSAAMATLGKRAVGIRVVDLQGERISFAKATGRHFGKVLSAIILMIGFIMAAFTERKQALHDIMAGTLVVKP